MKVVPEKENLLSREDLKYFIASDLASGVYSSGRISRYLSTSRKFVIKYRKYQRFYNIMIMKKHMKKLAALLNAWWLYKCRKYNVEIPLSAYIGPGFRICHLQGIVINPDAIIGRNFSVSQGCTVGHKNSIVPTIGDNVEMMIKASILGEGCCDHVSVGAHALVIKSVEESYSTWAGVPAKKISDSFAEKNLVREKKVNGIKKN